MSFSQFPPGRLLRVAAVSFALGLASVTFAEPTPPADAPPPREARAGGENRPRPMMELFDQYNQLADELKLDVDQSKHFHESMRTARESFQAMARDAQTMSGQERMASFNQAIDTMNADITTTLNEDQKKTFDTKTAEIRQNIMAAIRRPRPDGANGTDSQTTTRPGGGASAPGGGAGRMTERLDRALEIAEVTPEQRDKLKPIFDDVRQKMMDLMAGTQQGGAPDPEVRDKRRAILEAAFEEAGKILSPEQSEKFRAAMEIRSGGQGGGGAAGGGPGSRSPRGNGGPGGGGANGDPPPSPPPGDKPQANNSKPSPEAGAAGLAASGSPTTRPVAIGEMMPAFEISRLDGHPITNKSLAGKPAVLIFGSLSAPSFRDRVPMLNQLAKKYGSRARFLVVYTREQHPLGGDEPERNRDDHISVAAAATAKDRVAAAKLAHDQLELTLDVAVDSIGDTLTNQLDGFPNGAVVFDAEGKLADHEKWVEPFAIERALDRIFQHK